MTSRQLKAMANIFKYCIRPICKNKKPFTAKIHSMDAFMNDFRKRKQPKSIYLKVAYPESACLINWYSEHKFFKIGPRGGIALLSHEKMVGIPYNYKKE